MGGVKTANLLVGHLEELEGLLLQGGGLGADLLGVLLVLVGQQLTHLVDLVSQVVALHTPSVTLFSPRQLAQHAALTTAIFILLFTQDIAHNTMHPGINYHPPTHSGTLNSPCSVGCKYIRTVL